MRWFLLTLLLTCVSLESKARVTPIEVQAAVRYHGPQTEERLNDLLKSDYHEAMSNYYFNRTNTGFVALERFDLALTRAIGDIRTVAYLPHPEERRARALHALTAWQRALQAAVQK